MQTHALHVTILLYIPFAIDVINVINVEKYTLILKKHNIGTTALNV